VRAGTNDLAIRGHGTSLQQVARLHEHVPGRRTGANVTNIGMSACHAIAPVASRYDVSGDGLPGCSGLACTTASDPSTWIAPNGASVSKRDHCTRPVAAARLTSLSLGAPNTPPSAPMTLVAVISGVAGRVDAAVTTRQRIRPVAGLSRYSRSGT
jgi:hypothetical protein